VDRGRLPVAGGGPDVMRFKRISGRAISGSD